MVNEIERRQHELHAKLPAFGRKVETANAIMYEASMMLDTSWYCAFSGGIDSLVLVDLLNRQNALPVIDVLWGDDGWDCPETLTFLRETEERYHFSLRRIQCLEPWRDWCLEMDAPDLVGNLEAWKNPHEWSATWQSLKDARLHGYGGVFLGLLASESRSRSYALKDGWKPLYQVKSEHGMWHCSPLAHFTKRDIWAYVVSRGLAYNPVYDTLAELGVPLEYRRVAPLTCFRVMQYGSVVALKSGWPELFNKLAATFPKVREYA